MSLTELLTKVGGENIEAQWLASCLTGSIKKTKTDTRVTFCTSLERGSDLMNNVLGMPPKYLGLLVWIPREDFEKARAELAPKPIETHPTGEASNLKP